MQYLYPTYQKIMGLCDMLHRLHPGDRHDQPALAHSANSDGMQRKSFVPHGQPVVLWANLPRHCLMWRELWLRLMQAMMTHQH